MNLDQAIVRILIDGDRSREAVGAGFLFSHQHIFTCSHVVADALDIPWGSPEPPTSLIHLDFPLSQEQPLWQAKVIQWYPFKENASLNELEDIAVLELIPQEGKQETQPVPLIELNSKNLVERQVRMCGFPKGMNEGDWINASLQGVTARGWVQLETEQGKRSVAPGFSGTGVLDKKKQAVVGMIVSIHRRGGDTAAYMFPTSVLAKAWPKLQQEGVPSNPYKALDSFQEDDAPYFFGRNSMVESLKESVEKKSFTPLIGASGSGKSSLVYAGLLSKLRQSNQWIILNFRPQSNPFQKLAIALLSWLYSDKLERARKLKTLPQELSSGELGLNEIAALVLADSPGKRLLIIIDQFEELYTLNDRDLQNRFLQCLFEGVEAETDSSPFQPQFSLLITMRIDFMQRALTQNSRFAQILNAYPPLHLGKMNAEQLFEVMTKPAAKKRVSFEEGLVERILQDLGEEPGSLPLLEFSLSLLWEKQVYLKLTHKAYQEIGGVRQAIAHHADTVYQRFSEEEQKQVRSIFIQLVQPGIGTGDTRQVATEKQIDPSSWPLVFHLADHRLIVTRTDEKTGERSIEISHEALIHNWKTLQGWMVEDRDFRLWQNRLRQRLEEWQNQEEGLLQGNYLEDAQKKLQEYESQLTQEEKDYIQASSELKKKKELEKKFFDKEQERQRMDILHKQSLFLTAIAEQENKKQNFANGILMALEALPQQDPPERPSTPQAFVHLYQAVLQLKEQKSFFFGEEKGPTHFILSPDQQYLFISLEDGSIIQFDLQQEQVVQEFLGHKAPVYKVSFNNNDRQILSSSKDQTLRIWDQSTGECLFISPKMPLMRNATFSPDGQQVLVITKEEIAQIWSRDLTQVKQTLIGHQGDLMDGTFSPDGKWILTSSKDHTARLWESTTGKLLQILVGHGQVVYGVSFSPDSYYILTASADQTARLWSRRSGKVLQIFTGHHSGVYHAIFVSDHDQILTSSKDQTARLWDRATGKTMQIFAGHERSVRNALFNPKNQKFYTFSRDATLRTWSEQSSHHPQVLKGHQKRLSDIHFSPEFDLNYFPHLFPNQTKEENIQEENIQKENIQDPPQESFQDKILKSCSYQVLTASYDYTARLWNVQTGECLHTFGGHDGHITNAIFSPDGKEILTASKDKTIRLWDRASGYCLQILTGHGKSLLGAAYSHDGQQILTSSKDGETILWDRKTGQSLHSFPHSQSLADVEFHPHEPKVLTATITGTLQLWNSQTGERQQSFSTHNQKSITQAIYSPTGREILTSSNDFSFQFLNSETGELIRRIESGHRQKFKVRMSPDGTLLLTICQDGLVYLWNSQSEEPFGAIPHLSSVLETRFSPDGKWILTACKDGSAHLWKVLPQGRTLIEYARQLISRKLSPQQRKQFYLE